MDAGEDMAEREAVVRVSHRGELWWAVESDVVATLLGRISS